jgi:hypothetical protein
MKFPKLKLDLKTPNVGKKDAIIRAVVAVFLLIGFWRGGFHNWVIALIALGLVGSAWTRVCPAYSLVGRNTLTDGGTAGK